MSDIKTITLEEAKQLKRGQVLHHPLHDTKCVNWRVNGRVKTWKRSPERVEVPIKHGLWAYAYLDHINLDEFHFENDCPLKS